MIASARIRFLGTGASGGTPGRGRSRRTESSALVGDDDTSFLIDLSRDFEEQAEGLDTPIDAILLTHAHRDAAGGFPALRRWLKRGSEPIPVLATAAAIETVSRRFADLGHCELRAFEPGDRRRLGGWTLSCLQVPHARDEARFPTVAWKLTRSGHRLVYASDISRPTTELREFSRGAGLLVVDGATYKRRIFTHLRVDEDLPEISEWPVGRMLLTQIGRSCPEHDRLADVTAALCPRATPAYDGLVEAIP